MSSDQGLGIRNWRLGIGDFQAITHYPLPITHYQLPITNYQLPMNHK
ncbi:alpha/beta hydrolase [Mastigocoleus sp. MO_188.B34]|nr:alpha/beta hydrolase [Mastigocoleus sp. MO_188.B34]MDJ0693070.1 alpha/beta hydrolase [Mastigocoleus sp. MO_188.B34]